MLWDHSNKWKQKHTSFWWKPLRTNHKMPHSFTLIVFHRENELFQRGWGVFVTLVEIPEGWGGHQFPAKMENPGGWGGPKWDFLCGGGLDIFWNYTIKNFTLMFCQTAYIMIIYSWRQHNPIYSVLLSVYTPITTCLFLGHLICLLTNIQADNTAYGEFDLCWLD